MTRNQGNEKTTDILTLDHYPTDSRMRDLGFTDYNTGKWWQSWHLGLGDIFFNLTIDKVTLEYGHIVFDVMVGQPYHYGMYLSGERAAALVDRINEIIAQLSRDGIRIDYSHAEYGYQPQEAGV